MTRMQGRPRELTEDQVLRLCEEAEAQGEPTAPILRRYALQTIDGVIRRLEAERKAD